MPVRWAPFIVGGLSLSWSMRSYALKGQGTIKNSLGTTDARPGELRRDEIHAALQPIISKAKEKIDGAASRPTSIRIVAEITAAQQQHMLDQVRQGILTEDDESSLHPDRDINGSRQAAESEGIKVDPNDPSYGGTRRRFVEGMVEIARNAVNSFDIESITENCAFEDEDGAHSPVADVDQLLNDNGLALPENHPQRRALALGMLRTKLYAWSQVNQRLDGVPIITPEPPPPLAALIPPETGPLISQLLASYKAERKPGPTTANDYTLYVGRFISLFGDLPVKTMTKAHMREFKTALVNCPANIPSQFSGKPFAQAVEWGIQHPDVPRLSAGTINDRGLGALSAIFGWAVENDLMESNPRRGIKVPEPKVRGDKRRPYNTDDLRLIFNLKIFENPPQRPKAGAGEAARWLPLIALFTGARLQEIGQLRVADISHDCGTGILT